MNTNFIIRTEDIKLSEIKKYMLKQNQTEIL